MTFNPVKYVIFDMDGLLLDTERIYSQTFTEVLNRYGVTYDDEMKMKVMGTIPRETYRIFITEYNLSVSPEKLYEEMKEQLMANFKDVHLMSGAERLIRHLKKNGVPIAVATSSCQESFNVKTVNFQELFSLFNHIVLGSSDPEVKFGKPAPDIFLICATRFQNKPDPSQVLVFEDAPNGVLAARAAGMQVIMVPDPIIPEEKRTLATKVISSLLEFKPEEFGLPSFD